MATTRIPSVPLILSDPYLSIWSPADKLNDEDTVSWTDKRMPIHTTAVIDGTTYSVVGRNDAPALPQTNLKVTPTQSTYTFEQDQVQLVITFAQHFDLKDLQSISEPLTYISVKAAALDGKAHSIALKWQFDAHITYETLNDNRLVTKQLNFDNVQESFIGKAKQAPLSNSGDLIDIDWGYLYLAGQKQDELKIQPYDDWNNKGLEADETLDTSDAKTLQFIVAYDDLQAINYFGVAQNAYWKKAEPSMPFLLQKRLGQFDEISKDCDRIDETVLGQADKVGGSDYQLITATAYRQAIAAHKLIRDEDGNVVFLSKENNSNGCIGTVDVSYPSIPIFLAFNPELVQGLARPIFRFAKLPAWPFDFAPHDVGRYPYATGQVYGMNRKGNLDDGARLESGDTLAMLYSYPAESDLYEHKSQMPVEESGDMILMTATADLLQHDDFLTKNHDQLVAWSKFLIKNGQDPENQLCTDDFAGHLAHNVNLSLKAIVALGALGKAFATHPEFASEGEQLLATAAQMAKVWEKQAPSATDSRLAFDQPDTWSLKYNLVWDKVLHLNLFDKEVAAKDVQRYLKEQNGYGTPLDNRADYTKTDWELWAAALATDKKDFEALVKPVAKYLQETESRVPFSDWYDTKTGRWVSFRNRSVIGGVFMPLLQSLDLFAK